MARAPSATSQDERRAAAPNEVDADAEIRAANQALERRVGSKLDLPITLLVEQRNQAFRLAQAAWKQAEARLEAMTDEQDRFIAFLMSDYERQLETLEQRLRKAEEALDRERKLVPGTLRLASSLVGTDQQLRAELQRAEERIIELQEALQEAYREVDGSRNDLARLEQERDEAISEVSDLRLDAQRRVEAALDEVARLSWQLDEARHRLEEARDDVRTQAARHSEELTEVQRELAERNDQVERLQTYVAELDHEVHSRPPSSAANELEQARHEISELRRQLIQAKREQSRLGSELEAIRARRIGAQPSAVAPSAKA